MLTDGSAVLHQALGGRVHLAQVTLVIPSYWRDARCHMSVPYPTAGIRYQTPADVLITPDTPVFGPAPHTQQSRGCGQSGDTIYLPQSYLAKWNESQRAWGSPGKLFAQVGACVCVCVCVSACAPASTSSHVCSNMT